MSTPPPLPFIDRLHNCLLGIAIGDGMGAPIEGLSAAEIAKRFPTWDWQTFLPTQEWQPKGNGRITDDTLMTEALMHAYSAAGRHLDAFDMRDFLLPEMCESKVWVPERQCIMPIIERLNYLEQFMVIRLRKVGVEPRIAGVGNGLNCAIAMYIMPIGAVNAGDPYAAYQECAAFALGESHSFAVEGAAVLAAAYAAALSRGATVQQVLDGSMDLARDGTAAAIAACLAVSDPRDSVERWIERCMQAVMPFSNRMDEDEPGAEAQMASRNLPDPRMCFEEVPVALSALRYGDGDFLKTLEAACRFGRDADSISGMAAGLCAAVSGGIPKSLIDASETVNQRNWRAIARNFAATCTHIHQQDQQRWNDRTQAIL